MEPNNLDVPQNRNQKYVCSDSLEMISESKCREEKEDEDTVEREMREEESERSSSDEDEDIPRYSWTRSGALKKVGRKCRDEMTEKFREVQLDSQSSDTTDNSDSEEADSGPQEEELYQNFPGNNRFSVLVGQSVGRRLSLRTVSGRILDQFRGSLDTAVELAIQLPDDDPVKMELLEALRHHLCILREDVKDNLHVILTCEMLDLHAGQPDTMSESGAEIGEI